MPNVLGFEEATQVKPDRVGEDAQLLEGEGIDDLFIEPFEVSVCLVGDVQKLSELAALASTCFADFGQPSSLASLDQIGGLDRASRLSTCRGKTSNANLIALVLRRPRPANKCP